MDITRALAELGVREDTLSAGERTRLDRDGFVHLRSVLTSDQLEALSRRQAELVRGEGARAGAETYQEAGTDCLADLINKGRAFHVVLTTPRVLAAVAHVLGGDLRLSSLNSRSALPGQGRQHLHADWDGPPPRGGFAVANSVWLLDDFTAENGATRVVPGSHRSGEQPQDDLPDPGAAHEREILLLGRAGDVFVFNGHLWHGGTRNRTDRPRRAMHAYFCRRDVPQQHDQQKHLKRETWDALSEPARVVLGVTGRP
jgi:ectoine hydroxylase-related dioxygenase (phytanoyl-CoA dioxygenase family)